MPYMDAIQETSYLSAPNAGIYRKIMRYFYREYEKMHFQLYKEDIYRLLKTDSVFSDYTIKKSDASKNSRSCAEGERGWISGEYLKIFTG